VRGCVNNVTKNMQNCATGYVEMYNEFANKVFTPNNSILGTDKDMSPIA